MASCCCKGVLEWFVRDVCGIETRARAPWYDAYRMQMLQEDCDSNSKGVDEVLSDEVIFANSTQTTCMSDLSDQAIVRVSEMDDKVVANGSFKPIQPDAPFSDWMRSSPFQPLSAPTSPAATTSACSTPNSTASNHFPSFVMVTPPLLH